MNQKRCKKPGISLWNKTTNPAPHAERQQEIYQINLQSENRRAIPDTQMPTPADLPAQAEDFLFHIIAWWMQSNWFSVPAVNQYSESDESSSEEEIESNSQPWFVAALVPLMVASGYGALYAMTATADHPSCQGVDYPGYGSRNGNDQPSEDFCYLVPGVSAFFIFAMLAYSIYQVMNPSHLLLHSSSFWKKDETDKNPINDTNNLFCLK